MFRSLAVGSLAALVLASCQSARPKPLDLQDRFPIEYHGRIQPAERLPDGTALQAEATETPRAVVAGAPFVIRAAVVEVAMTEIGAPLRQLRSDAPYGAYVERAELAPRLAEWRERAAVLVDPELTTGLGAEVVFRSMNRRAFVSHLDCQLGEQAMLLDPAIGAYEYGTELTLRPRRDGDVTTIAFEWRSRDNVTPVATSAVAGGRLGRIQLPIMFDQRVRGEARVVPGKTMIVGSMVGSDIDKVRLLCVDVDEPAVAVAAR